MAAFLACMPVVCHRHDDMCHLTRIEPYIVTHWDDRRRVGFRTQGTAKEEAILAATG